jgi:hypothetical protein
MKGADKQNLALLVVAMSPLANCALIAKRCGSFHFTKSAHVP